MWKFCNLLCLQLRFCVKSNIGEFKQSKNVIFGTFRASEFWFLVNLALESCSKLLKSKLRTSKIAKNDVFWRFEFTNIWFHAKSELQANCKTSTPCFLDSTFWKFLKHSALLLRQYLEYYLKYNWCMYFF